MIKSLYILLVCYMPILDKYMPKTNFGPGIPDLGPVRFFSYLLIFFFGFEFVIKKQARLFSKWVGFISLFFIVVLASVSWSKYSYSSSVIQSISNDIFLPLIIVVIGLNLFSEGENVDTYIKNILIAAFLLSLISIYQLLSKGVIFTGGESDMILGRGARSAATLGNPNALAIFFVLIIPCLIYALEKQLVSRNIGRILSVFLIGGLLCTISRKGIATGVIAFCIYYYLKRNYKKVAVMGIVVVFLAVILSGFAVFSKRFSQEKLQRDLTGKWIMTYAGLQMFRGSPLIGLGYQGYYENFGKYFPYAHWEKYDAHNIFITALANYGLIGFIPFLGIFLYPVFTSRKVLKADNDEESDSISTELAIVCISSVIPFMINGWFAGGLFNNQVLVVLLYTNISLFLSQITR